MNATARLAAIRELYERIPKMNCKRLCGGSYCGPVPMSPLESRALKAAFPEIEFERWQGVPGPVIVTGQSATCPLLAGDCASCRAYDLRPAICRLWGTTEKLKCPHGCEPERWLEDSETRELLSLIHQIGQ